MAEADGGVAQGMRNFDRVDTDRKMEGEERKRKRVG
jgi:hypothetical protein